MKILVADDDPVVAMGLTRRLLTLGHEPVGPAADGAQAVALAKSELPDLYLFDIEMPELDGLAAATELAKQGLRRPVVVVTGVEDPELVDRSIDSGVSAYLTKLVGIRVARHGGLGWRAGDEPDELHAPPRGHPGAVRRAPGRADRDVPRRAAPPGHAREPRVSVSRSVIPLVSDLDRRLFGADAQ